MQRFLGKWISSTRVLWSDEGGQSLIEHSLLMAFICLAAAAMFIGAGGNVKTIWTTTNSTLANAAAYATGGS